MKRAGAFVLLLALCMAPAMAQGYALDFSDDAALESVVRDGRQTHRAEEGYVLLRGGSSVYAAQATGPGVYHVRFRLVEADKFQYHVPMLEFFKADANDPASNGYALMWQPWGMLTLRATVDGERVHSRQFIDPGRDNPNRYAAGDAVDLTLRIPPEGDCVEVYTFASTPEGEPTCRFKLLQGLPQEALPQEGHFGWRNTKWFSHTWIHQLGYQPGE